ncbi:MAG: 16S rRNA (guanine(527)-N(7))-methyltransferase RsmG [Cytophagales bacterium]
MELIAKYFPNISQTQKNQFGQLLDLYTEWNEKINVVSRKDIENLYINHVLHSLSIVKIIQFEPQATILDVGTGGGFPGIPLAIMFPDTHFHLVDSIGKKIKVVNEVAYAIKLKNVLAEQMRVEELDSKYDFVVSRGVTSLKEIIGWNLKNIKKQSLHGMPNGLICLKGGDRLIEEIGEIHLPVKSWLLSDFFVEEFFIEKKVVYVKLV